MIRLQSRVISLLVLSVVTAGTARAQVTTGTPPFGSFSGAPDIVNNANLNVRWSIPVLVKGGRQTPLSYSLGYDSSVWYPVGSAGSQVWTPVTDWGWKGISDMRQGLTGIVTYSSSLQSGLCPLDNKRYWWTIYYNWAYRDLWGNKHTYSFAVYTVVPDNPCGIGSTFPHSASQTDVQGYRMDVDATSSLTARVYSPVGDVFEWNTGWLTDRNGNKLNVSSSRLYLYDTMSGSTPALTVSGSGTPASPKVFTYTKPQGGSETVTVNYTSKSVKTNFGCSGITEYGPYDNNLITSIATPEGTYTLDYEATPGYSGDVTGRIKSVTLPTGGTIYYTYSGGSNGITCADGSAATLSRQTPDGTSTYAHTESGTAWTTTITDPQSNQTILNFQTIYETKRQVKNSGGTTLLTVDTCYNGATIPCTGTSITLPIARRTMRKTLESGLQSKTEEYYNSQGLPTEVDDYAYGLSLVRKRLTSYASLGNNIYVMPSSITIKNSGGSTVAQTTVGFDQTSVVPTSGTPQHGSVSGSRGNKTTITYTVGASSLSRTFTNYDTGRGQRLTDVNGAQTTYNYPDATSTCGNAFPTSVSLPKGMSRSMSWNCNAAKEASATDQNGRTTSYTYDSLFRVTQTSYPDGGSVTTNYTSATVRDIYTAIVGGTSRHDQITLDGLGRTITESLASDPSGAVKVGTTYDSLGRVSTVSNPYRSLSDPTYGKDTYSYDALGRVTAVSHQDGTSTHTYYGSAVGGNGGNGTQLCATGTYGVGDPTLYVDETGKKRQTWTDALGRIIEVDEPGSGGSLTVNTCYKYDLQ